MDKTRKKSKSMEEISKISGKEMELSRTHLSRLGQPIPQTSTKKRIHVIDVDRIDEEDDHSVRIEIGREMKDDTESARGSQISKKSQRSRVGSSSSKASRTTDRVKKVSSTSSKHGTSYDNAAYDSTLDGFSVISRSSTRASSISLEVQREQYCCFSKWSPFERKLAALVMILVTVIIILVIAVVVLATANNGPGPDDKSLSS